MAFSNENIKDKLCGGCDCAGFVPAVGFTYNAGAKTIEFTDSTVYTSGDSRKIVHLTVYDKDGRKVLGNITAEDVDNKVTVSTATLDASGGLTLLATVISAEGCLSDGHTNLVGIAITAGSIGYWDKDYDGIGAGPAVSASS